MSKALLICLPLVLLLTNFGVYAQKKVYVSEKVVKTAQWARFKYRDELKKALNQDAEAVRRLLEFSGTVDNEEALEHAVTCLEMIPSATDDVVAMVVADMRPQAKKMLLERLSGAGSRTQKAELKKPLGEWAPNTWAALNGRPLNLAPKQQTLTLDRSGSGRQSTDKDKAAPPAQPRN